MCFFCNFTCNTYLMKQMILKIIAISIPISFLFGCSSNSSDDLLEPINPVVKYTTDIAPIISNNCVACHTDPPVNGAPMRLTTYSDVKSAVLNRGLIDRISRSQGAPGMMPNGGTRLPQASIDKIIKWQSDGFVE